MKLFNTVKKKIAWFILGGVALAAPLIIPDAPVVYQELNWTRPTTDQEWAEDVKQEQLNFKFDYQLKDMKASLEAKVLKEKERYDQATLYSDSIKWEFVQQGLKDPELTKQVNQKLAQIKWEYEKVQQSLERINKEIELRNNGKVNRKADILTIQPSTPEEKAALEALKK